MFAKHSKRIIMWWRHCLVVAAVRVVVLIMFCSLFGGLFDAERARVGPGR